MSQQKWTRRRIKILRRQYKQKMMERMMMNKKEGVDSELVIKTGEKPITRETWREQSPFVANKREPKRLKKEEKKKDGEAKEKKRHKLEKMKKTLGDVDVITTGKKRKRNNNKE